MAAAAVKPVPFQSQFVLIPISSIHPCLPPIPLAWRWTMGVFCCTDVAGCCSQWQQSHMFQWVTFCNCWKSGFATRTLVTAHCASQIGPLVLPAQYSISFYSLYSASYSLCPSSFRITMFPLREVPLGIPKQFPGTCGGDTYSALNLLYHRISACLQWQILSTKRESPYNWNPGRFWFTFWYSLNFTSETSSLLVFQWFIQYSASIIIQITCCTVMCAVFCGRGESWGSSLLPQ